MVEENILVKKADLKPRLKIEVFYFLMAVVVMVCQISPILGQSNEPVKINVGDSNVSGNYLKPGISHWKVTTTTPDGRVIDGGTWSDELQIIKVKGRKAIRRLQEWKTPDGKVFQNMETVADAKTLAPIVSEFKRADGMFGRKEYEGALLKDNFITPPSTERFQKEIKLETPVFDFGGGLFGLLLAGFPLKDGYTASLPIDFQNKDGQIVVKWLNFQVSGQEKISNEKGQTFETLIVKTETENGKWSFWLNKKQAPFVFKVTFKGPAGNTRTWSLV